VTKTTNADISGDAEAEDATQSVFVRIPAAALRYGAVNLAQGVFDHGPETALLDALARVGGGTEHQYTPSAGHPLLRDAVARHVEHYDGTPVDPEREVTITAGATEGLHCVITALVGLGDEAIIVEPAYEQYAPVVRSTGARVTPIRLASPRDRIGATDLAALIGPDTRAIIVNTPWNPLGRCLEGSEWEALAGVARQHGIVIVSDETYEHLNFDGVARPGVLHSVEDPELRVKVSSASKTFAATGWRVGWVVAGPKLTRRIRAVHQFVTFCPAAPLQLAVADVLSQPGLDTVLRGRAVELGRCVHRFVTDIDQLGLDPVFPDNGFFVLADVGEDAEHWCDRMIAEAGVAALPVSVFYSQPVPEMASVVRFAVCKLPATLDEAVRRLRAHRALRTVRRDRCRAPARPQSLSSPEGSAQ
jgi:aspartate/methionine/tyrosine aminotransferase